MCSWFTADEWQLENLANEDGTIENEHTLQMLPILTENQSLVDQQNALNPLPETISSPNPDIQDHNSEPEISSEVSDLVILDAQKQTVKNCKIMQQKYIKK